MSTNAIRLLESAQAEFSVRTFDPGDGHLDAVEVADLIGVEHDRVFKTLVCEDPSDEHIVFVIPGPSDLDLKKAAEAAGVKRVRMLALSRLTEVTGYVRGGCSPVGMKRKLPTYIEESAELFDSILVSAGARGIQVEIEPHTLATIVEARFADLV